MKFSNLQKHKTIGLDTMIFIYLVEQSAFAKQALDLFRTLDKWRIGQVCSTIVITELLQKPIKQRQEELIQHYQKLLLVDSGINFVALTVPVATSAAVLSGKYSLRTADAIHLASALEAGASAFVTVDKKIKSIPGLEVIYL